MKSASPHPLFLWAKAGATGHLRTCGLVLPIPPPPYKNIHFLQCSCTYKIFFLYRSDYRKEVRKPPYRYLKPLILLACGLADL